MLEIAHVIQQAGPAFRQKHEGTMLPSQQKALRDILDCRTPARGGHVRECDQCGVVRYSYHSCGNRHCPKCQGARAEEWTEAWKERLLDCPYYFLTFTLPDELRNLAWSHQRVVYGALMRAAGESIAQLARDRGFLGGTPGMVGVLHTWTRDLRYHPHVHFLVTGGGLADDGRTWRLPQHSGFLMPGRVLSALLRDKFRGKLRAALDKAGLTKSIPRRVWRRRWVVHAQQAGRGQAVLGYLARSIHRVALPNSRLEHFDGDFVTFRYREGRTQALRRCRLSADEFLSRFLQHVLPRRFVKVRAYGLFASARRADLGVAHELLEMRSAAESCQPPKPDVPVDPPDLARDEVDPDPLCHACKEGRLRVVAAIPRNSTTAWTWARAPPIFARQ